MSNNVHFSSNSDLWETPQKLFNELNEEFGFVIDVAATANNSKCAIFLEDGLAENWDSPAFCNPPFPSAVVVFYGAA